MLRVRLATIRVVHASVNSARKGLFATSETFRILLNVAKVSTHLCTS